MNSYELSRKWFDWCFDNPEKVKPNHTALYFFCIEHCNRLGWQEKFGLPTEMAKSAIGIHSYNTYINTLNDLIEFGFIIMITKSKNQFSSNIIGLSNFNKATTEALDKAIVKHITKQGTKRSESIVQSIDSIDKPLTKTETNTLNQELFPEVLENVFSDFLDMRKKIKKPATEKAVLLLRAKLKKLSESNQRIAIAILEQSITNNWQDIFPLRQNTKKNDTGNNTPNPYEQLSAALRGNPQTTGLD